MCASGLEGLIVLLSIYPLYKFIQYALKDDRHDA
jgi:hypothetical protein